MIIREACLGDFGQILELYSQLHPEDPAISDGRNVSLFESITSSEHLFLFVGVVDANIVATCYLNLIPNLTRNASPYGIIENVVTEQKLRNLGYGKAIIRHALKLAWTHGSYKVMLQTGSAREATHNFYKSCGFAADDKFAFVARPA
ncbi:MAG: GNAT family N-acetyltransferase [Gammaproteobacteria bacterium]|jgi:GNAT superfamily N-acetyltransferase|nr:GNAT family N-acetyltransferase [Gammaproteobacteria bacterium]MBT6025542.1 GNAT family N-acetyltransferase [Gammaproteobacteria bacterium]